MKETKKQIKAQLINEVSAQYRYKMARLENQIKYMENRLVQQRQETLEYRQRALRAEEELEKYQDWNRRLQEFMDMDADTRDKAIAHFKVQAERDAKLNKVLDFYRRFF